MEPAGRTSNVAKAISRSRRARAEQRSRRRRSVALAALIAASLGGAEIWSIGAANGTDMVEAAVTHAKSLADLIGQRSPGERTEAQLTKSARAQRLARRQRLVPGKRANARHAAPPKVKMADVARLLESPPPPLAAPPAATPASFPQETLPTSGGTLAAIVAPSSGVTPPGGGSPPASFPTPQPKTPITVPSAVPEPGTWAMMLLGFALIGWRARRNGRSGARNRHLVAN